MRLTARQVRDSTAFYPTTAVFLGAMLVLAAVWQGLGFWLGAAALAAYTLLVLLTATWRELRATRALLEQSEVVVLPTPERAMRIHLENGAA